MGVELSSSTSLQNHLLIFKLLTLRPKYINVRSQLNLVLQYKSFYIIYGGLWEFPSLATCSTDRYARITPIVHWMRSWYSKPSYTVLQTDITTRVFPIYMVLNSWIKQLSTDYKSVILSVKLIEHKISNSQPSNKLLACISYIDTSIFFPERSFCIFIFYIIFCCLHLYYVLCQF